MVRPPPPAAMDLTEDKRAMIAILLRLISRRIKEIKLWLGHWLIIASLVSAIKSEVCMRWALE